MWVTVGDDYGVELYVRVQVRATPRDRRGIWGVVGAGSGPVTPHGPQEGFEESTSTTDSVVFPPTKTSFAFAPVVSASNRCFFHLSPLAPTPKGPWSSTSPPRAPYLPPVPV